MQVSVERAVANVRLTHLHKPLVRRLWPLAKLRLSSATVVSAVNDSFFPPPPVPLAMGGGAACAGRCRCCLLRGNGDGDGYGYGSARGGRVSFSSSCDGIGMLHVQSASYHNFTSGIKTNESWQHKIKLLHHAAPW